MTAPLLLVPTSSASFAVTVTTAAPAEAVSDTEALSSMNKLGIVLDLMRRVTMMMGVMMKRFLRVSCE